MSRGGCVFGPRELVHGFVNTGVFAGRLLVVATPAGLENYFRKRGRSHGRKRYRRRRVPSTWSWPGDSAGSTDSTFPGHRCDQTPPRSAHEELLDSLSSVIWREWRRSGDTAAGDTIDSVSRASSCLSNGIAAMNGPDLHGATHRSGGRHRDCASDYELSSSQRSSRRVVLHRVRKLPTEARATVDRPFII